MPVFEEEPDEKVAPQPEPIKLKIEPIKYEGITIDTKYTPSSAILAWAQGSNWTVDYYRQELGRDSEPASLALEREKVYQQYRLIKGMVLKVNDALTFDQATDTRIMTASGSGWTLPFLTPNQGDMFIANVGDGQLGLFTISEPPRRKTILRDSIYEVTWTMVGLLSDKHKENLDWKVIQTLYYSHSSMLSGCGPFVSLEEQTRSTTYSEYYQGIIKRYLTDFFSNEHSTLLVPDQWMKTYDHFIVKMFLTMIGGHEDIRVRRIRALNVMGAAIMKVPTVLDALLYKDPAILYGSTQRAHLVATRQLRGQPTLQAIGFTGIDRMVYPMEAPTDIDSQYDHRNFFLPEGTPFHEGKLRRPVVNGPVVSQTERDPSYFKAIPDDIELEPSDFYKRPADIHPVVIDQHYIFSTLFYNNAKGQSKLELLANQAIKGEELNYRQLDQLLGSVYDWDNLERFYYHPVVLVLLRLAMR